MMSDNDPTPRPAEGPVEIEKELTALRRIALAAAAYRETILKKRTLDLLKGVERQELQEAMLDIGSAEFELTEALNEWRQLERPDG